MLLTSIHRLLLHKPLTISAFTILSDLCHTLLLAAFSGISQNYFLLFCTCKYSDCVLVSEHCKNMGDLHSMLCLNAAWRHKGLKPETFEKWDHGCINRIWIQSVLRVSVHSYESCSMAHEVENDQQNTHDALQLPHHGGARVGSCFRVVRPTTHAHYRLFFVSVIRVALH